MCDKGIEYERICHGRNVIHKIICLKIYSIRSREETGDKREKLASHTRIYESYQAKKNFRTSGKPHL